MVTRNTNLSRRQFVGNVSAAASSILCGYPQILLAQAADLTERQRALNLLETQPSFDLHCHPGLFFTKGLPRYPGPEAVARKVDEMLTGRLWGGFFAFVSDMKILQRDGGRLRASRSFEPGEAWAEYERQIVTVKELSEVVPVGLATQANELEAIPSQGRVAAFVACEGGDCLEGQVGRLERLYADGVRSLQLVHYAQNELGDLQTEDPVHGGLSQVGREAVQEMNRLGIVIDLAHASFATTRDVAELSDAPIIISHSALKHGAKQHPRLLDPDHADVIAATGGVIGMWPLGYANDTFAEFVDNTLQLVDLVGIDHVGLGTDMGSNYRSVLGNYQQLPDWTAALLANGLSESDVSRLVGGNAHRVLREVLQR